MTDISNNQQPLPPGYEFQDEKLRVERVLGAGGFGITYLVRDLHVDDYRVLKENFPKSLSLRASGSVVSLVSSDNQDDYDYLLNRFIFESEQLQRFSGHPNIANVVGSFRANNTAYMLMSYRPGKTLAEHIQQNDNRPLSEDEIKLLCLPVLKGLQAMHAADLLHLDIKPENIYIPSLGEPYLIDFGGARHFSSAESQRLSQYSSMVRTPGYAPPEQSSTQKQHRAATDLYAFGATLYYSISSQAPIDANDRRAAADDDEADPLSPALKIGAGRYSEELLQAIDACLRIKRKDRPQSVAELLQLLPASWQQVTELQTPDLEAESNSAPDNRSSPLESKFDKAQLEVEPIKLDSNSARPLIKPPSYAKSNEGLISAVLFFVVIAIGLLGYANKLDKRSQVDQSNWKIASANDSIAAYQTYLNNCAPTCKYRLSARQRMGQLQKQKREELQRSDELAWQIAKSTNNLAAYRAYLQNCSSICVHRSTAEQRVEQLRELALTIRSNVYSDEVWIDGRSYGSTPISVSLISGAYDVRVSKAGYYNYVESVRLTQERTLWVELHRLRPAVSQSDLIQLIGSTHSDYTKLDALGNALPRSAESWSCVLDRHSGLIWEVKTADGGIHDKINGYRWGGKGVSEMAFHSVDNPPGNKYPESRWDGSGERYDDWNTLVDAANAERLCGLNNWRVASFYELASLVRCRGWRARYNDINTGCLDDKWELVGNQLRPTIDINYFPNTQSTNYWSASPIYDIDYSAGLLSFFFGGLGHTGHHPRFFDLYVRLVSSSQ